MSKFVSKVTDTLGLTDYAGAEKAAKRAAGHQSDAIDKQIQFLTESEQRASDRLQPFVDFGLKHVGGVNTLLNPMGQATYLANNPLFGQAIDYTTRNARAAAAASGQGNSGGMVQQLFNNYLATGQSFIDNQLNRLMNPVMMAQNSAAGQGANIMNMGNNVAGALGNQGDVNAAYAIQRGNIGQQQAANMQSLLFGGLLGSGKAGGEGIAGGGATGALLGSLMFSDERLKDVEERIGTSDDGLPIYRYKYKGDPEPRFGILAQDLEQIKPDAVYTHKSGYKLIDTRAV